MTTPAVRVDDLDFAYSHGSPVLEDVSLEITEGDFVSIIGPNGGGKTTLVRLILGLLNPTRGTIEVLGTTPERARPRIGAMPQHATGDPRFPISVLDVVLMGRLGPLHRMGPFRREDRDQALAVLGRVGLADVSRRPFSALSGGQRQRVLLARALASDPEILLLDEPAANMDQKVERDLFDLLEELNRTRTVIVVSHDLGFVASMVRTVVCVHRTVDVHPTSALDGGMIHHLYGGEVRMVHHDHSL